MGDFRHPRGRVLSGSRCLCPTNLTRVSWFLCICNLALLSGYRTWLNCPVFSRVIVFVFDCDVYPMYAAPMLRVLDFSRIRLCARIVCAQ